MTSRDKPSLPVNRNFVIQLYADTHPENGHWQGRVEPLVSMESEHFESLEQLTAFIVRIITTQNQSGGATTCLLWLCLSWFA